jgi:hypothetical protein
MEIAAGQIRELQDQVRGMSEMMAQFMKAQAPPPTMRFATPGSSISRLGGMGTPFGSRFGAVDGASGVRRPLFLRPPVVSAPLPSPVPRPAEVPSTASDAAATAPPSAVVVKDPSPPRVNQPPGFKGTMAERDQAQAWLNKALSWLAIAGKGQPEAMLVEMFGQVVESDARIWYDYVLASAKMFNTKVTVQQLEEEFLEKYAGGVTYMTRQQELSSLVYGKGKCVDVVSTQTEFERLVSSLYPGASLNPQADQLLAMAFAEVYKRGDFYLWEKAVEMGPVTLDEWKAAVQRAVIIRQTVMEGRKAISRITAQPPSTPSRPFQSSFNPARVHQMQTGAAEEESDEEKSPGRGVESSSEGLQNVGAAKRGTSSGAAKPKEGKKWMLTWAERLKFSRRGQCFHCYAVGHIKKDCPDKSKPARRPTEAELNE